MPISILMSEIIFKYLPLVRRKLVSKLKVLRVIEIWHTRYFKYANLDFDVKNVCIKYLPTGRSQLVPK